MKSNIKKLISVLLLFVMLPCFVLPSAAMTPAPPTNIQSSKAYGVQFSAECGIVIENQTISYNIPTLPAVDGEMNVEEYTGSLTTEYTLYNPTDREIRLSVVLPLSKIPKYNYSFEEPDVDKYIVTIDGKTIDKFVPIDGQSDDYTSVEYEYEITVPPSSRVVHTVTSPIYPGIETAYEPPTYFYEYSLHTENAELFSGNITVNINTPYYIIPNEFYAFEKTNEGYSLTMPPSESFGDGTGYIAGGVFFTLCESENPEKIESTSVLEILLVILIPIVLVSSIIYSIIAGVVQIGHWVSDLFN